MTHDVPDGVPKFPPGIPPAPASHSFVRYSFAVEGESIQSRGGPGPGSSIARVNETLRLTESINAARPPFSIQNSVDGALLCSVRPVSTQTYEVFTADGVRLAQITRRGGRVMLWPRRVRWNVQIAGIPQSAVGRVGSWYTWLSYVVFSPLWAPFWLCMWVYSLIEGSADDFGIDGPTHTIWRGSKIGDVMEYRGVNKVFHLDLHRLDYRVAYAQAVLHVWDRR